VLLSNSTQAPVDTEKQIRVLEDAKLKAEKDALWHESQGSRLQFIDGNLFEAKKHFKIAEAKRKLAQDIQIKIDLLKSGKSLPPDKPQAQKPIPFKYQDPNNNTGFYL
jgi:hypothetical protein